MYFAFPLYPEEESPLIRCCTVPPRQPDGPCLKMESNPNRVSFTLHLREVEEKSDGNVFWSLVRSVLKKDRDLVLKVGTLLNGGEDDLLSHLERCPFLLPLRLLAEYRSLDGMDDLTVLFASFGNEVPAPMRRPELLKYWHRRYGENDRALIYACGEDLPEVLRKDRFSSLEDLRNLSLSFEDRLCRLQERRDFSSRCMPLPSGKNWMEDVAGALHLVALDHFFAREKGSGNAAFSHLTWKQVFKRVTGAEELPEVMAKVPAILSGSLLEQAFTPDVVQMLFPGTHIGDREHLAHIVLQGVAGTGKSTLGYLILLHNLLYESTPHVVYMGPTRMLVEEAYATFRAMVEGLAGREGFEFLDPDGVVISTGERIEHDERIRDGAFQALFIVYEKLNNFFHEKTLCSVLTCVMVDEVQMICDPQRGGVLDVLLTGLCREAANRVALSRKKDLLRLVICTTEAFQLERQLSMDILPSRSGSPKKRPPVVLTDKRRFIPVSTWYQYVSRKGSSLPLYFGLSQQRQMDGMMNRKWQVCLLSGKKNKNNWLQEWMWGHEKVLYVSYTQVSMISLAHELCSGRPEMFCDEAWLSDFYESLHREGFQDICCDVLTRCARKGILFTFSDMVQKARIMSTAYYKSMRARPGIPIITFATSTIMYGVNLPADLLILGNLRWPRFKDKWGELDFPYLSSFEMHNITGRVGRYGVSSASVTPTIVLCGQWPPRWQRVYWEYSKECRQVVQMLSLPETSTCAAALLRKGAFCPKCLGDFHPAEQAFLINALLHAPVMKNGQERKLTEVQKFIESTWAWAYVLEHHNDDVWKNAIQLFYGFLQEEFPEMVRVSEVDGKITIWPLPFCFMVSKTGVSLGVIKEIKSVLNTWTLDSYTSSEYVVLVLLSLLMTQEGWRTFLPFLQESSWGKNNAQGRLSDLQRHILEKTDEQEQEMRAELHDMLLGFMNERQVTDTIAHIQKYFYTHNMPISLFGGYESEVGRRKVLLLFRSALALLSWCRGKPAQEINRYRYADGGLPVKAENVLYENSFQNDSRNRLSYMLTCFKDYCSRNSDYGHWENAVEQARLALLQVQSL